MNARAPLLGGIQVTCFCSPYWSPVNQWLLGARLSKLSLHSKSASGKFYHKSITFLLQENRLQQYFNRTTYLTILKFLIGGKTRTFLKKYKILILKNLLRFPNSHCDQPVCNWTLGSQILYPLESLFQLWKWKKHITIVNAPVFANTKKHNMFTKMTYLR